MNDEIKRMLKLDADVKRLTDPLGTMSGGAAEVFRLYEEEEHRRKLGIGSAMDTLKQFSDKVEAVTGGGLDVLKRRQESADFEEAVDRLAANTLTTHVEGLRNLYQHDDWARRQRMIDEAIGKLSSTRQLVEQYAGAVTAGQRLALSTRPWDGTAEITPAHFRNVLEGLIGADGTLSRFGNVSAQALAAVALQESAGLTGAHRETYRPLAAASTVADELRRTHTLRPAAKEELAALAAATVASDRLAAYAFGEPAGIAVLQARMAEMDKPWLSVTATLSSATSFAHVQAIGDVVGSAPPYASAVSSWLRTGMGDWRDTVCIGIDVVGEEARTGLYVRQGVDEDLAATPPKVIVHSAAIALLYKCDGEFAQDWLGAAEDDVALAKLAFDRLFRFETAVRNFISQAMEKAFGGGWTRTRLPSGMLDEWKERQDKAVAAGERPRDLIAYADFTDYLKIIEKKDNWREVFESIFLRKDDVRESLQRLYPVRLSTMHGRVVTTVDLVLLWTETKRVVSAFSRATGRSSLPH